MTPFKLLERMPWQYSRFVALAPLARWKSRVVFGGVGSEAYGLPSVDTVDLYDVFAEHPNNGVVFVARFLATEVGPGRTPGVYRLNQVRHIDEWDTPHQRKGRRISMARALIYISDHPAWAPTPGGAR
jgi:hypothetical protein